MIDVKRRILDAALLAFAEHGVEQTATAAICARAGVSNGSLFHHFGSKEGIAEALFLDALERYQSGLVATIERHAEAQSAVREAVAYHLDWVERHRGLAYFLFERGRPSWSRERADKIGALNAGFGRRLSAWLQPHQEAGRLAALPPDIFAAILIGPAQVIARAWIAGERETPPPSAYAAALAAAAIAALCPPATLRSQESA